LSELRVLIADDEEIARRRLQRLLAAMPDVTVAGEAADGEEALRAMRGEGVDVVLLDIQMPGLTGLEAAQLVPEGAPYVIFSTANPDHAVAAFETGAVDYLLKPVDPARLKKALDRARNHLGGARQASPEAPPQPGLGFGKLAVPTPRGVLLLDPASISHAVLENELVTIFHAGGEVSTDMPLQELQDRLPKERFLRVHRRVLLNMEQVVRLEPVETGGYLARTARGQAVTVSRQSARELRRRLGLRKTDDE
jgi:two-component system LytT family response regulator